MRCPACGAWLSANWCFRAAGLTEKDYHHNQYEKWCTEWNETNKLHWRGALKIDSKLYVSDGDKIERGAKLFEWDPYTLPIIAEADGKAKFVDLTSGISVRDETDDATLERGAPTNVSGWSGTHALP